MKKSTEYVIKGMLIALVAWVIFPKGLEDWHWWICNLGLIFITAPDGEIIKLVENFKLLFKKSH